MPFWAQKQSSLRWVMPMLSSFSMNLIIKGALDSPKEEIRFTQGRNGKKKKKGIMIDKLYRYLNNLKICEDPN